MKKNDSNENKSLYLFALLLFMTLFLILIVDADTETNTADIYIQAGHEGRVLGNTGAVSKYGKEIDWTPIVANEATRLLREAGFTVIRAKADRKKISYVKLAISIHFDGSATPCAAGASIGYGNPSDKPAANQWRKIYRKIYPYRWKQDNYTRNLRNYYNYKYTVTSDAELLLELGELTCPKQAKWLKPRLKKLGRVIAYFATQRMKIKTIKRTNEGTPIK